MGSKLSLAVALSLACFSAVSFCACGRARVAAAQRAGNLIGEFEPTFYRTLDESSEEWEEDERTEELHTRDGRLIARVTPEFKSRLDVEGSARLRDGRVVNFSEKVGGSWTYLVAEGATYGLDAKGRGLIPYRTLAVDPEVVPLGSVVYLPSLDGIKLPSGETHDGLCLAQDTGQTIVGHRIDIFVGFENDEDNTLTQSGRVENEGPLSLYGVDEETAHRFLSRLK